MRVLYLCAGAGDFYCGTCIRDTNLVHGLRALGHDVEVLSLYLPLFPEKEGMGQDNPIFFGGVNVYLQQNVGLFRVIPMWSDRLLSHRRLLKGIGKHASSTNPSSLGPMTVSMLRGEKGNQRKEVKRLIRWIQKQEPFDVICLSNLLLAGLAEPLRASTGARVVATMQGEEGFLYALPDPYKTQSIELLSEACSALDATVAVSANYGERMASLLDLPEAMVSVVWNGIDTDPLSDTKRARESSHRPVLGYFARMCPEKGLKELVHAFLKLRSGDSVSEPLLRIGGSCTKSDEPLIAELKKEIHDAGLTKDVSWHPNLSDEEKRDFMSGLDIFCVPGPADESFGLYVIEAMASGLPVLAPNHAAFPEIVAKTGGGVLYDPSDSEGLVVALLELLATPERAHQLGSIGRKSVCENFTSMNMSRSFSEVLEKSLIVEKKEVPAA